MPIQPTNRITIDNAAPYIRAATEFAAQGPWVLQFDAKDRPILTADIQQPDRLAEAIAQLGWEPQLNIYGSVATLDARGTVGALAVKALVSAHLYQNIENLYSGTHHQLPPLHAASMYYLAEDKLEKLPQALKNHLAPPPHITNDAHLIEPHPWGREIETLQGWLKSEKNQHGTRRQSNRQAAQDALSALGEKAPELPLEEFAQHLSADVNPISPMEHELRKHALNQQLNHWRYSPTMGWQNHPTPAHGWLQLNMDSPEQLVQALAEATHHPAAQAEADMLRACFQPDSRLIQLPLQRPSQAVGDKGPCLYPKIRGTGIGKSEVMPHLRQDATLLRTRDHLLGEAQYLNSEGVWIDASELTMQERFAIGAKPEHARHQGAFMPLSEIASPYSTAATAAIIADCMEAPASRRR